MPDPVRDPAAAGQEPILLKNRIAVLTPDPIAEGAFGKVYVGKILNPVGLIAERIVWGEESPRWLGVEDVPWDEAAPAPIQDPGARKRIYEAAERLWSEYFDRRGQDRAKADEEYRDLLNLIDPLLHEDRVIAVKVLRPPLGGDPDEEPRILADSVRRFIKENDILRTLRHPNIVRRFGLVRDARMGWCLLLEYLEGETLDLHLHGQPEGRMPLPAACRVVREIAEGIRYIHGRGVVHRDLKPANIMVCAGNGRAVLMDFGIGKWADESQTQQISQAGFRVGTPRYMAPEQVRVDGAVTRAADVYQLSTVFFELVTGQAAYGDLDQAGVFEWLLDPARRHPTGVHDLLPSISRELETLIEAGRDKDPARRWTIDEFIDRLDRVVADGRFEGPSPYHAAGRARLTQALHRVRVRAKEAAWEEHLLQTRLHLAELRARMGEAWELLARKSYEKVRAALEVLSRDISLVPIRQRELHDEFARLDRAFRMATARYEAEYLIGMAEQHFAARRYPDAGAAIDGAAHRLAVLPIDTYADVHRRFRKTADGYEARHRSYVELFNTLRKSFVDKLQERVRDLQASAGSGRLLDPARIAEVLQQVAPAEKNLGALDRDKVGPAAFDAAVSDLRDVREVLLDLLKRVGAPA